MKVNRLVANRFHEKQDTQVIFSSIFKNEKFYFGNFNFKCFGDIFSWKKIWTFCSRSSRQIWGRFALRLWRAHQETGINVSEPTVLIRHGPRFWFSSFSWPRPWFLRGPNRTTIGGNQNLEPRMIKPPKYKISAYIRRLVNSCQKTNKWNSALP